MGMMKFPHLLITTLVGSFPLFLLTKFLDTGAYVVLVRTVLHKDCSVVVFGRSHLGLDEMPVILPLLGQITLVGV